MSIHICCDRCGSELVRPGALAFSPPSPDGRVTKVHLCAGCSVDLFLWLSAAPAAHDAEVDRR